MERLTDISLITGLAIPIKFMESCGEDGCADACEQYVDNGCVGCPLQECISELHNYQSSDLTPIEVEELKKSENYWHREALKWANKLGEEKFRYRELLNKFGIPESIAIDEKLEKELQAFIDA